MVYDPKILKKVDEVIQVEGEISWETKSTLSRFGFNEPSSRLWGMIMLLSIYLSIYLDHLFLILEVQDRQFDAFVDK